MSTQTMTLILIFRCDGTYQAVYCKHCSTLRADKLLIGGKFLFLELRDNWYGTRDNNSKTLEQKDKKSFSTQKNTEIEKY